jgi:hypothetical protein
MTGTGLGGWRARALLGAALMALAAAGLLLATTRIEIEGRWRGLFLLKARDGRMLELQDDLYLGDGSRLVAGVSFSALRRWLGAGPAAPAPGAAALELDWDERTGRGLVRNRLGDGSELVTLFGRFEDDHGNHPRGLFVGGAVPDVASDLRNQDQSGMALREGGQWFHVWCNTNEALVDMDGPAYRTLYPGDLRFLGSRVLVNDPQRVVLESNHEVTLLRGRVRMDRFAYFAAGEPFFKLGIRITALGPQQVTYAYLYGDEPWVGHFGTATGNYGWVDGEVVPFEGKFDTVKNRWAGIVDLKTGLANYLEWLGDDLPDDGYFANQAGHHAATSKHVPLDSNEVFIGLQWVGRRLAPGEGRGIRLVIGLAGRDPATGKPIRPPAAAAP